jgi:protein involved in polysaccharide export with SLBB domain
MKRSHFGAACMLLLSAAIAGAQTPTSDQLNALKNLPQDQQDSLLQGVLGKTDNNTKKTDSKLTTPETVQPKNTELSGQYEKITRGKTVDGRILRQADEDPELRADDSVLIELAPADAEDFTNGANGENNGNGTGNGGANVGANGGRNTAGDANNPANAKNLAGAAGYGMANRDIFRAKPEEKPKTDEEKEKLEKFRQRILSGNPYRLNRFGVLEIPGLPAIPLAGLTADEATKRLSADPDLQDYRVRLSLLRLLPFGEDALKPFGYDLFEGVPSTFAPVSDIQVPVGYIVGVGDTLDIELYGSEPASYTLTVERDGRINFPKLGPIMVSGMTFDEARTAIERRVAQQLIGTRVSVAMGDLRSIRVFVLGEAEKPGSYTVSGLSTMTNALFVSGGVKKIGSLRNIQLKRDGRLITVLDLYDLLLHGDTSKDQQLLPDDVIFIPPIGKTVSVDGAVRRPAIYELKSENTVSQIVDLAGGLLPDADERLVQLERILPSSLREMRNIDLTTIAGRTATLANGDKLRVPAIRPTLENSVTLTGWVFRPGSFEYHAGLRLSDILGSFDELRPSADLHYIMIRREIPPEERVEVLSADLQKALAERGSTADPPLRPRDQIFVFNLSASRERILAPVIRDLELQASPERPEQVVRIDGRVKAPGEYPLEPKMRVSDLIRAGGSLEDSAFRGQAELTRYQVIDGDVRHSELINIDLAAIRNGNPAADLTLLPYDVLVVKPIPQWQAPGTIELAGEVRFPGKYPIFQGETLYSVLQRGGGLTDLAFGDGAVFIREELKKRERDQIELLTNRLQSDLASLSLQSLATSAATTNGAAASNSSQGIAVGQQLLDQLRNTKPVGRLVIDLNRVLKGPAGSAADVMVRDGDKLAIPKRTQEITILGEVQSPTSHVYQPGLTRDDYIAKSGGITQKADRKRIYVVRANGDVISGGRTGWFHRSQSTQIHPGDTIVVPLDAERVRALPLWTAVTTIIYNIAIAVLALRNL